MKVPSWTIEIIQVGFEQFLSEHGRLPKAHEVDECIYLPSSRSIQKRFGGLEQLRMKLGYKDTHFGKGKFRSKIADRVNNRGRNAEKNLERILHDIFGEVFVHTEKMFDTSKNRVDFYIYSPDGNFGIDIFYSDTLKNLQSNVNIKMRKYQCFHEQLFLITANDQFKQSELNSYANSKVRPFPKNITLLTQQSLLNLLNKITKYHDPL